MEMMWLCPVQRLETVNKFPQSDTPLMEEPQEQVRSCTTFYVLHLNSYYIFSCNVMQLPLCQGSGSMVMIFVMD